MYSRIRVGNLCVNKLGANAVKKKSLINIFNMIIFHFFVKARSYAQLCKTNGSSWLYRPSSKYAHMLTFQLVFNEFI